MKLLPESPVEFLETMSQHPEKVYAAEFECGKDSLVLAGTENALLRAYINVPMPFFIERIESEWGSSVFVDDEPLKEIGVSMCAFFNGSPEPIRAVIQPIRQSPFTIDVHRLISRIPWGGTLTYGDIAVLLNHPGAARAVGTACGKNPVLVVVPCHRVVASQGLGGFGSGGLELKKKLLMLEGLES